MADINTNTDDRLETLLIEYEVNEANKFKATWDLHKQVEELTEKIKQLEHSFTERQEILMHEIKELMLQRGKTFKVSDIGTIMYRSGYTKINWDTKGLQGLAKAYPAILELKTETDVDPVVYVKLNKK